MSKSDLSSEYILASVESAIDAIPFPVCIYDQNDQLLLCSSKFRESVGPIFEGLEGHAYTYGLRYDDIVRSQVTGQYPVEQVEARIASELKRHRVEGTVSVDMNVDGAWLRRSRTLSPEGSLIAIAVPIDELVERTRALVGAKQEMEHQALHDPLTDLPNRRALNAYLERVLKDQGVAKDVVVFHVDLDKFKLVNDTLGHDAGDCVLLEASKILRSEVRATDFVARVGGDEFVMVFTSLSDGEAIARVAQRIVEKMREPIYYDDHCCQIGASIGIAVREECTTPEQIVMDADIALYQAKLGGRGRYAFFYSQHRAKHQAHKKRVVEVREAIIMNAFEPFFQPQICMKTGKVTGFEALARWSDRETGIRPPSEFLDAISEANLFAELDEMIIRKALRRLSEWDALEVDVPTISVNLSTAMLSHPDLPDRLKWMCDEAGIAAERLCLEVLETVMVDDQGDGIAKTVGQLKAAGFSIALDDFGTGNASISNLRYLAPQRIKIAREFVKGIHKDDELRTITAALVVLAQNLGMNVLGEGVDDQADAQVLDDVGCEYLQGFLIAKPMESDFVPIWMSDYYEEILPDRKRA